MVPLDTVILSILVGTWVAVIGFSFYYLFGMNENEPEIDRKKADYRWGIIRYCFSNLWFTAGCAFFLMNTDDWDLLCRTILDNITKVVGVFLWLISLLFLLYFFKMQLMRRRAQKKVKFPNQPEQIQHLEQTKNKEEN